MQGGLAGPPRNPLRQRSIAQSYFLPTVRSAGYRAVNVALRQRPPKEREILRIAYPYRSSSSSLGLLAAVKVKSHIALSLCSHLRTQALMLPRHTTLRKRSIGVASTALQLLGHKRSGVAKGKNSLHSLFQRPFDATARYFRQPASFYKKLPILLSNKNCIEMF